MVHQNALATLTPTMTIGDQIAETIRQHNGVSWKVARQHALEALAAVNIPSPETLYGRFPHQLSGGQRQRVSIAIAISLQPDLLILDEPTTALDVTTEAVILDLLRSLKAATKAAMIYISHNLAVVGQIADRVAVMYAGEIVEIGAAASLFRSPSHPYTGALVDCLPDKSANKREVRLKSIPGEFPSLRDIGHGCVFRSRCNRRLPACEASPDWQQTFSGSDVRCFSPLDTSTHEAIDMAPATGLLPGSEVALAATNLSKYFGRRTGKTQSRNVAVNGASIEAKEAEIVGLVGESGSGKTTFLRCLAGLADVDQGGILLNGRAIPGAIRKRGHETLKQIQMVFQDPHSTLNPAITVGENLVRHIRALDRTSSASAAMARAVKAIQNVRLNKSYYNRYPAELSGGEKQRVAIARAFAAGPSVVLCDEPLSALDVSVQSSVVQLLLDLQAETKASYILVSHDLSVIRYVADRIVVMYLGHIVDEGTTESFERLPLHPYTEALLSAVPSIDMAGETRIRLDKQASESDKATRGCVFASRCPRVIEGRCHDVAPDWQTTEGRRFLCHHDPDKLAAWQSADQAVIRRHSSSMEEAIHAN